MLSYVDVIRLPMPKKQRSMDSVDIIDSYVFASPSDDANDN